MEIEYAPAPQPLLNDPNLVWDSGHTSIFGGDPIRTMQWTGTEDVWPPSTELQPELIAESEEEQPQPHSSTTNSKTSDPIGSMTASTTLDSPLRRAEMICDASTDDAPPATDDPPTDDWTVPISNMSDAIGPMAASTTPNSPPQHMEIACERQNYELRPQTRQPRFGFTTTWLDQDDTGNYDPDEENRKRPIRRTKTKVRETGYSHRAREYAQEPVRLEVQLKFRSGTSRDKLAKLVQALPNDVDAIDDYFMTGYRLRNKNAAIHNEPVQPTEKVAAGSDIPDDLTGHPIARGCWGCLGLGIRCPLLDDERAWPCVTCVEDDHDCDLVTPPTYKRPCERCKRRRDACSYTYSSDHSEPCVDCANEGYRCVAGPAKDTVLTRIRYDRDWVHDPLIATKPFKPKVLRTCLQCRKSGKTCSFTCGSSGDECTACEMSGITCVPEKLRPICTPQRRRDEDNEPRVPKKKRMILESDESTPTKRPRHAYHRNGMPKEQVDREFARLDALIVDSTKPPMRHGKRHSRRDRDEDSQGEGTTKKITTKFCHPISFNHEDGDGTKPCNFCDGTGFSIMGFEPREVAVIDWADGHGLDEISGGYKGDGVANTRMCTQCTMKRVPAAMCPKHELTPIPGMSNNLDNDGALLALFEGKLRKRDRWCSVCPALATYECEAEGSVDAVGNACKGCGLLLCEGCMLQLTGFYNGDLQPMLAELKDESTDERPLGLRADYELLKQDGLLMRYVMWSAGQ